MKSLQKNALFVSIRTIVSLILPLLTFPYLTRTLQVASLGKYNFSLSVISYFLIIAELGISTYAIREGSKIRNDKEQFNNFISEIYSINILSTGLSYISLFLMLYFFSKFDSYTTLILILSVQIFLNTFGKLWIFSIFEEFGLITIVQLFVQLFNLIFLFLFVNSPKDVNIYALIQVVTAGFANVFYGILSKKYCKPKLRLSFSIIKKHIKPIILIFSSTVASIIYVNSDLTLLGLMIGDECVGLYSASSKIYTIVKQVLLAVISVAIPRLSFYTGNEKFKDLFAKIFDSLILIIMPASIGLLCVSENVIYIIAGDGYANAVVSLQILSITLVFALSACLFGTAVLIPYGHEKVFFIATFVSALINIVLNFLLIPRFQQNAAAFTTLISEIVVLAICYYKAKDYVFKLNLNNFVKILIGCLGISIVCYFINLFDFDVIFETVLCVSFSIITYFLLLLLLKNKVLFELLESILRRK